MENLSKINSWRGKKLFIGLDVHKKSWKVTILGPHYEHKTFSQDPDPTILANYLNKHFPEAEYYSVYEAGFSGFWASKQLKDLGINNIIVNPADVPTKHKEKNNKNDKVDSRKLARTLQAGELTQIYEPSDESLAFRQVMRSRYQLSRTIAREKNRIKSFLFFIGQSIPQDFKETESRCWSGRFIKWLENLEFKNTADQISLASKLNVMHSLHKELLTLNRHLRKLSKQYQKEVELLMSIPGIGQLTAMNIIAELTPICRFKSINQLNQYVGLVPSIKGSGEKEYVGEMTSRGNKRIKINLIESSWVLVRKDPAMMLKFGELSKRMCKQKAIIRIARKLLNRIRHVLLTQEPYLLGINQ